MITLNSTVKGTLVNPPNNSACEACGSANPNPPAGKLKLTGRVIRGLLGGYQGYQGY